MSIYHALSISVATRYIEMLLVLVSTIVLSRLLTPEDFGIYSIAAAIVAIGYTLRNFGVGQFLVQAENLTDDLVRAAFTLTLSVSWALGLLIALSASWLADYYQNPGVEQVMLFLSINFLILPFGAVSDAVLRRQMRFDRLAIIQIGSGIVGLVVGISAALLEARYMAIVWGANASTLVTVLLTAVLRPAGLPWRPGLRGLRQASGFGLKVGVLDLVNKGSDSATELVVGKAWGLHDLGIYSRGFGSFMLFEYAFIEAIRPVVLPYLSEANRHHNSLGPIYLKIVAFVSMCMMPFFVFLYAHATDVLLLLYGDQWSDAVPILQVLCLAGLLLAPTVFFEQLLIANGRPGQALRYQAMFQATRLGVLVMFIEAGLEAAAVAFVIGAATKLILVIFMAHRYFQIRFQEFFGTSLPALIATLAIAAMLGLLQPLLQAWENEWLRLVVSSIATGAAWLALVWLMRHPIRAEIQRLWSSWRRTQGHGHQ